MCNVKILCEDVKKLEPRYFRRRISLIVRAFSLSHEARTRGRIFYFVECNVAERPFLQIFSPQARVRLIK